MEQTTKPKRSGFRKFLRVLFTLMGIALVFFISFSMAQKLIAMKPKPKRHVLENVAPLVETLRVQKTSQNMIIQAYGTVRSGEILSLTAEVRGKIVEMASEFEEGGYLPKGSFIMRIDPRNYRLAVERLQSEINRLNADMERIEQEKRNFEASLKIVEEDLRLTKAEYERNRSLSKRKVVSQTKLDQSRQAFLTSRRNAQEIRNSLALINPRTNLLKTQREAVKVQLKEARLDLERTEIRAPFDCRVAQKSAETGQFVSAGTRVADIYNVGIMEVEVRIPPREVPWLHFNSGESVEVGGNPPTKAQVTFRAGDQNIQWEGIVARIKGQMEESTRTLPVVVQVQNGHPGLGHPILPGMFVSVEIVGKRVNEIFLLPQDAVHEDQTVYVVEEDRIRVKPVDVFRRRGNQVYIRKGLNEGDLLVTRFPGVATDGMKVRIKASSGNEGGS